MNTAAAFDVDRQYYATYYSAWLKYRSRWRWFAIPMAALLLLATIAATILLPQQRTFTFALLVIAAINASDACSHRWRWIRERIKTQSREKHVDLVFNDDHVVIRTPNSKGTIRYTAFTNVTITPGGIFLMPDTGVSVFVPRTAFASHEDFQRVAETVREEHATT